MTTTLNAENAARLVSEARKEADQFRGLRNYETADLLDRLCNLIERHATPQTQATHGEGEAVAYATLQEKGRKVVWTMTSELWEALSECRLKPVALYKHPAPSPTAAPALGGAVTVSKFDLTSWRNELHACQAVIHLRGGFDPAYVSGAKRAIEAMEAALSGVAAQGDGGNNKV
jgi:hypothetical protein